MDILVHSDYVILDILVNQTTHSKENKDSGGKP